MIRPQPGPQEIFLSSPADIAIYGGSAGGGKALPLTTEVYAPCGFVELQHLRVGDTIYDQHFQPCQVTHIFDAFIPPVALNITFNDVTIKACADHLWLTIDERILKSSELRIGDELSYGWKVLAVTPAETEPMMCIAVDSADHTYVITRHLIPTHNSFALLMEPLRHLRVPGFMAVFFRRNMTQVKNPGGLWDESMKLYPLVNGEPVAYKSQWKWPQDVRIEFAHLEHANNVFDWQGSQIPLIAFDELTHFEEEMFWYMLSRNRSVCGVKPYIRASTNPDPDSWVANLIAWWIDQETGYPIPERSGVLRWFLRLNGELIWADTKEELIETFGNPDLPYDHYDQPQPKSLTFVPAKLTDNKILMQQDPGYMANLKALTRVNQARLLGGNWKVRGSAGDFFRRQDITIIDSIPRDVISWVRGWDLAGSEVSESNPNPDWTAGVLMGRRKNGRYVIADVTRGRWRSAAVHELVRNTAAADQALLTALYDKPVKVKIRLAQDPGQAGKDQIDGYLSELTGYMVEVQRETGKKEVRADPFASAWQLGLVELVAGNWNDAYLAELEGFPSKDVKDDQVDASSGTFLELSTNTLNVWTKLGRR